MRESPRGLIVLWAQGVVFVAAAPAAETERARVVVLTHGAPEPAGRDSAGTVRQALAELGWKDGVRSCRGSWNRRTPERTARALGVTVPRALMVHADRIIE